MFRPSKTPQLRLIPFIVRRSAFQWYYQFTASGRAMVVAAVVAMSAGSASLDLPIYPLICALCGLLVSAFVVGFLVRPKLRIAGGPPRKASAGQAMEVVYTLTNTGRFPAYDLGVGFYGWPRSFIIEGADRLIPVLGPGESGSFSVRVCPVTRGVYPLPEVRGYSTFPLGLLRQGQCTAPGGTVIVQPNFGRLEGVDVPIGRRYQPGGIALSSGVGESAEFIGNRDYVPGDPMRLIDFRSWGRLARPVVKEFQEEYFCRVALVLDTYVPRPRRKRAAPSPELEAGVSLAATVADALAAGEYLIDIFAAGPDLHVFRAGRNVAHFENVLEILAGVDACHENPFAVVSPALADELVNISTVICVLLDWDDDRRALVTRAREAGCDVKLIVVREGETTLPLDTAHEAGTAPVRLTPTAVSGGEVGFL